MEVLDPGGPMHGDRDAEIREYSVKSPGLLPGQEPARPATVGRVAPDVYTTPIGQLLTPAGQQVELPGLRPQAIALSPDGKVLVTTGKKNVMTVMDSATGCILQSASLSTRPVETQPADKLEAEDPALAAANEAPARRGSPPVSNAKLGFTGKQPGGGAAPGTNDPAAPAGRGSQVRVDQERALPTEGCV